MGYPTDGFHEQKRKEVMTDKKRTQLLTIEILIIITTIIEILPNSE